MTQWNSGQSPLLPHGLCRGKWLAILQTYRSRLIGEYGGFVLKVLRYADSVRGCRFHNLYSQECFRLMCAYTPLVYHGTTRPYCGFKAFQWGPWPFLTQIKKALCGDYAQDQSDQLINSAFASVPVFARRDWFFGFDLIHRRLYSYNNIGIDALLHHIVLLM